MYGVESFVHPAAQGSGVGSLLLAARFDTAKRLNLRGVVAGSLIIGYRAVAHEVSVEQYVREVVAGIRFDPNLSKQLRKGFSVMNIIPKFVTEPRSCDYGVAIIWRNPEYRSHTLARRVITTSLPAYTVSGATA